MTHLRLLNSSERVLNFIKENPGCHLRKVKHELGMSMGSVQYQLALLERRGKLVSARRGSYKFYFPSGIFQNIERKILQVSSIQTTKEMLIFIIEQRSPTQTEIANTFKYPLLR